MSVSIKSNFVKLTNNLVYACAPDILNVNTVLPEYQIQSEKVVLHKNVVIWSVVDNVNIPFVSAASIVDMVGDIVSLNVAARGRTENISSSIQPMRYTILPKDSLENIRIFTDGFVYSVKCKSVDTIQSAEDSVSEHELLTSFINISQFTVFANWLPNMRMLRNFDDNDLFATIDVYKILAPDTYFLPFPQCVDGLATILQPWVVTYVRNLLYPLFPAFDSASVTSAPSPEPADSVREMFKEIYNLLCHFNGQQQQVNDSTQNFKLAVRHLIHPFLTLPSIKEDWVKQFFNIIFTRDIGEVTKEFSKYMPKFGMAPTKLVALSQ